ncbi:MAG: hypothetical protein IJN16_01135 [Lachnospiraceae bacterium]|nr:hypothetical protein [Lachnospiraceae bacterium]
MGRGRWRSSGGSSTHGAGSGGHGKRKMVKFGREFCPWGEKCLLWEESNSE